MDIEWSDVLLVGIIVLLVGGLVFVLVDGIFAKPVYEDGIVLERVFSAGKTGVGVGPVVSGSSSGGAGVAVVVTSTDDEWLVVVQTDTGVYKAHVAKAEWPTMKAGDKVSVRHRLGLITRSHWSARATKKED